MKNIFDDLLRFLKYEKFENIWRRGYISPDKFKNRLGYGKGFYDKYLKKYFNTRNEILKVGIAFSFQEYKNLPVNKNDYKLDYIITEKGIK